MSLAPAMSAESSLFPSHPPIGNGQGIYPGRVVWAHKPGSVKWNGSGFWWQPENFDASLLLAMFRNGIMALSGKSSPGEAWHALFAWRNQKNGKDGSYLPGQTLAIKPNMNGSGEYGPDPLGNTHESYGNSVLIQQLLDSLVSDAGVKPDDILVFDTCRTFPDYMENMCSSGKLSGVKFLGRDPDGDKDTKADRNYPVNWSGMVQGEKTWLPRCITESDYLINLANLKGHSWGLTLTAKNHFGSFVNTDRLRTPQAAGLHDNIINSRPGEYSVLADLISHPQINNKTILWMLDALITSPGEIMSITKENSVWEMAPFNGDFAASLFFSLDPVAIDSVGADFLVNEPVMRRNNRNMLTNTGMENYLHEAALLGNPLSGTNYGAGKQTSLGVHEHWNNPQDKQYSRNPGAHEGIELFKI